MIRVETGSRLHFGLLNVAADGRRFGGAGMMIDAPGVAVRVEPAGEWSAEGPLAGRAGDICRSFARLGEPRRVIVERASPEHAGLGTGTQLALAVGMALMRTWERPTAVPDLARMLDRGKRSGVGVHGFDRGGFLVDGGKGEATSLAPLLARLPVPPAWRVLLIIPRSEPGLSGEREVDAFATLRAARPEITDSLCRFSLLGALPALAEHDFARFGEAIAEYNVRSGELFTAVQGGPHCAASAELVAWLRGQGVAAGQSSWGPGVYGFAEEQAHGAWLAKRAREAFPAANLWLTQGRDRGADVSG